MSELLQVARLAEVEVAILPKSIERRDELLADSSAVTAIMDDASQAAAVAVLRSLKALVKETEDSRKAVKAPVLDIGRTIDGIAEKFIGGVEREVVRLNGLISHHQERLRKSAEEAERQRQAELKRQADEEQRRERERQRIEAEAAAAVEAARVAAEAEFLSGDSESARLADEAARKADEEQARLQLAEQARRQAEADRLRTLATPAPRVVKPKGMAVSEVWRFEVTDLNALLAARRDLVRVEANREAINDALRRGAREIPGLRIWSETQAKVRG